MKEGEVSRQLRFYRANKANGLCGCGDEPEPGYQTCRSCREARLVASRRRNGNKVEGPAREWRRLEPGETYASRQRERYHLRK